MFCFFDKSSSSGCVGEKLVQDVFSIFLSVQYIIMKKNKVTFIGPPSAAIESMGDKITSKKLAKNAGVSTVPGYLGEIESVEEVIKISNEIGYPVMI